MSVTYFSDASYSPQYGIDVGGYMKEDHMGKIRVQSDHQGKHRISTIRLVPRGGEPAKVVFSALFKHAEQEVLPPAEG
jgi:hypothetical protein